MSKKATASPSASAAGVGTITTGESGENLTSGQGGDQTGESGAGDAAGAGADQAGSDAGNQGDPIVAGGAGVEAATQKVAQEVPAAALEWAAGLEYPKSTFLRNNGHVAVVEPITAQIVGGGATVPVVLHDEAQAVAVLSNTLTLNALHFQGDLKVRLDAAPDELYMEG
ncbi:MAG: hypothetical protein KKD97_16490 [Gammaproteobacteria bacterium]|nr:hypothetical protein [Gammaproteobacteria bacterium]